MLERIPDFTSPDTSLCRPRMLGHIPVYATQWQGGQEAANWRRAGIEEIVPKANIANACRSRRFPVEES